jgi:hypothetical protein
MRSPVQFFIIIPLNKDKFRVYDMCHCVIVSVCQTVVPVTCLLRTAVLFWKLSVAWNSSHLSVESKRCTCTVTACRLVNCVIWIVYSQLVWNYRVDHQFAIQWRLVMLLWFWNTSSIQLALGLLYCRSRRYLVFVAGPLLRRIKHILCFTVFPLL